jgi:hypothetical protein
MSIHYNEFFAMGKARDTRRVSSVVDRNVALVISDVKDAVPSPVILRTTKGVIGNLNVAGATSFREEADRRILFDLVVRLFGGNPQEPFRLNRIALGSGGTRVLDKNNSLTGTMTAVETPGLAYAVTRQNYPDNPEFWPRTWGHTPRTNETLGYGGEHSSFQLAEKIGKDTIPNPLLHLLWILQKGASTPTDWNGDLLKYIELLRLFADSGEGLSGLLVLSGGGVTAEEVLMALREGIPVLGAAGTGRAANALIDLKYGNVDNVAEDGIRKHYQTILREDLDTGLIRIFDASDPISGQRWLQEMGFGVITRPSRM